MPQFLLMAVYHCKAITFENFSQDKSKTLEVEEVTVFANKILQIFLDFARAGMYAARHSIATLSLSLSLSLSLTHTHTHTHTICMQRLIRVLHVLVCVCLCVCVCACAAIECLVVSSCEVMGKGFIDDFFASMDEDGDGLLTSEQVFCNFPSELLDIVMKVPESVKGAAEDKDINTARSAKELIKTLKLYVQLATVGADKEAFFNSFKSDITDKIEWGVSVFHEVCKEMEEEKGKDQAEKQKGGSIIDLLLAVLAQLSKTLDGIKKGVSHNQVEILKNSASYFAWYMN
jgi:hypothetical protein